MPRGVYIRHQKGEQNFNWKGDKVGYDALHQWAKKRLVKPSKCFHCKRVKRLDLANKSGEYKRDLSDWLWLCRSCHLKYEYKYQGRKGMTGLKHRLESRTKISKSIRLWWAKRKDPISYLAKFI